jgi:hypothetical protein
MWLLLAHSLASSSSSTSRRCTHQWRPSYLPASATISKGQQPVVELLQYHSAEHRWARFQKHFQVQWTFAGVHHMWPRISPTNEICLSEQML